VQSQCTCEAHVHPQCLVKSAVACNTDRCTICRSPIANLSLVRMAQATSVYDDRRRIEAVLLCICSFFFSTMSILFFAAATEELERYAHLYFGCFVASLSLAIGASRAIADGEPQPATVRTSASVAILL
tara:strand:- start:230 stop:616 length:387 start_codon:yes stop_codon:yes gene_type:complete